MLTYTHINSFFATKADKNRHQNWINPTFNLFRSYLVVVALCPKYFQAKVLLIGVNETNQANAKIIKIL